MVEILKGNANRTAEIGVITAIDDDDRNSYVAKSTHLGYTLVQLDTKEVFTVAGWNPTVLSRSVSPSGDNWQNLVTALIPGVISQWNFDDDFTDAVGGRDMTPVNNPEFPGFSPETPLFTTINGLRTWRCGNQKAAGIEYAHRGVNDPEFQLLSEVSIWAILYYANIPQFSNDATLTGAGSLIAGFRAPNSSPDTEENNRLYEVGLLPFSGEFFYGHEFGAGVESFLFFPTAPIPSQMMLFSMSRDATGDVTIFMNGVEYGPFSSVPPGLPTGGTGALVDFCIGGDEGTAPPDFGRNNVNFGGVALAGQVHDLADHNAMLAAIRT